MRRYKRRFFVRARASKSANLYFTMAAFLWSFLARVVSFSSFAVVRAFSCNWFDLILLWPDEVRLSLVIVFGFFCVCLRHMVFRRWWWLRYFSSSPWIKGIFSAHPIVPLCGLLLWSLFWKITRNLKTIDRTLQQSFSSHQDPCPLHRGYLTSTAWILILIFGDLSLKIHRRRKDEKYEFQINPILICIPIKSSIFYSVTSPVEAMIPIQLAASFLYILRYVNDVVTYLLTWLLLRTLHRWFDPRIRRAHSWHGTHKLHEQRAYVICQT